MRRWRLFVGASLIFFLMFAGPAYAAWRLVVVTADELLPHERIGLDSILARVFDDVLGQEGVRLVNTRISYRFELLGSTPTEAELCEAKTVEVVLPSAIYLHLFSGIEKLFEEELRAKAVDAIYIDPDVRPPVVLSLVDSPDIIFEEITPGETLISIVPGRVRVW